MQIFKVTARVLMNTILLVAGTHSVAARPPSPTDHRIPITAEDAFALQSAGDAQISPDGQMMAYVRYVPNIRTDRSDRTVWLIDLKTGVDRPLAYAAEEPRWSPDSRSIAFVAKGGDGRTRLFVLGLGTEAKARSLTDGDGYPAHLAWSPDGKRIAFTKFVSVSTADTLTVPVLAKPPGASWAPEPHVATGPRTREDGSGFVSTGRNELFLVSVDSGNGRRVDAGDLDMRDDPAWDPDGERIVVSATIADDLWGDAPSLFEVDPSGNSSVQRLSRGPGAFIKPHISPDGRAIAYLHYEMKQLIWQQHLGIMQRNGNNAHEVQNTLDRDVNAAHWDAAGRLFFAFSSGGEMWIARMTSDNGRTVVAEHAGEGGFSVSKSGAIGFSRTSPDRPDEIAVAQGSVHVLTQLNAALLRQRLVGQVVPLNAKSSFDSMNVPGWAMLPPRYQAGRRYPTILWIHGGPWGSEGPSWQLDLQLMAAAGYVVLYANPRGSTSYGWAHTIALPIDTPAHDYDDLMSFVDTAITKGFADPKRLYVTGSSYGGIMTTWIVGKTHRFQAAVAEKPVVDFMANSLENDQYHYLPMNPRGMPWEHPDIWWRVSPLSLVGNVSTPTMLIAGEEDDRTPIGQARQFYNALQLQHVSAALISYPGASHGSLGGPRSQLISKTDYALAWFARHP